MSSYLDLLRFPNEILVQILANLEGKSLLACRTTCRRLDSVVSGSVLLQYKIELMACGMVEGGQALSVAEKMRRLRLYDAAWRNLEWTDHAALPHLADSEPLLMAVADSLVFQLSPFQHDSWTALQRVSSKLRGVQAQHTNFPECIGYDSMLDPSQDLMAYYEASMNPPLNMRCYLQALSTRRVHPLRSMRDPFAGMDERIPIEICGDRILEAVRTQTQIQTDGFGSTSCWDHVVWNWKTGRAELTLADSASKYSRFLDRTRVLTFVDHPKCIQVYTFGAACMSVHTFLLPMRAHRCLIKPSLAHGCPQSSADTGYFHNDPAERLLSLDIHWADGMPEDSPMHVFMDIPLETFRSYISAHPTAGHAAVTVPWQEWGQRTRVAQGYGLWNTELFTHGMRRLDLRPSEGGGGAQLLEVLDYHPGRVGRALARQRRGDAGAETVVEHSDALMGRFTDGVQTSLPCLVKRVPLPEEFARELSDPELLSARLCEDGVIFMEMDPAREGVEKAWAYTF